MREEKKVAVIGAGGHGEVVASTLLASGHHVSVFLDDTESKWGTKILDIPVIGPISASLDRGHFTHAIVGIGDNAARKALVENLNLEWISAIHPFSWVHPDVPIGEGTVICAGAIVQPGAQIGRHVIINTKTSVDHHVAVGDYCHLAVSHLAGRSSVGEGVFAALGSIVLPKIRVGDWSMLGAGAVVTKHIPPRSLAVGSPARVRTAK